MTQRVGSRETSSADVGTRDVEGRVEIDASPERVWKALTEAAELERWFPLEARVEPGEGGEIFVSWKNEHAGTSKILVWDPPRHLRTTWGSPEDEGGQAQVTDYHIEAVGGRTVLRVVTSGFPTDAAWDDWVEGTRLGWRYELSSLRHYLEEHDGEDRDVVYLRRRVDLSRREAWDRLFGAGGVDFGSLEPATVHTEEPRQYTAVLRDPPGGMLRLSMEPCPPGIEGKDVTFFLSAWGEHRDRLAELEEAWAGTLERLFPAGVSV